MGEERRQTGPVRTDHDEQETRAEGQVFQEIPEQRAPFAVTCCPEITLRPEALVKDRGCRAIGRHHERSEAIGKAGHDSERHDHLDRQART